MTEDTTLAAVAEAARRAARTPRAHDATGHRPEAAVDFRLVSAVRAARRAGATDAAIRARLGDDADLARRASLDR